MGSGADYKSGASGNGRWEITNIINDVKVLKDAHGARNANLPTYSSTSNEYFKRAPDGNIIQMRTYNENQSSRKDPVADFDFYSERGHTDKKTGKHYEADVVHVHPFELVNGEWKRSSHTRYMTEDEIKKYGAKILAAYPHAKFKT